MRRGGGGGGGIGKAESRRGGGGGVMRQYREVQGVYCGKRAKSDNVSEYISILYPLKQ